jgi:hypothetical protein
MVEANNGTHPKEMESSSPAEDTKVTTKKESEAKVVDEHPLFKHIADNNLEAVQNCLEVIIIVEKTLAVPVPVTFKEARNRFPQLR